MIKETSNYLKSLGTVALVSFFLSSSPNIFGQSRRNLEKKILTENVKIQRGVNAGKFEKETPKFEIYKFKLSQTLRRAIKNSKRPFVYTTDKKSFVKFDKDTSNFYLYYSRENFDKKGKGKVIGITIKDKGKISVCNENGLGRKKNYLPSFYWGPIKLNQNKEKIDSIKSKEAEVINNYFINNYFSKVKKNKENRINNKEKDFFWNFELSKAINEKNGLSIRTGPTFKLLSGKDGRINAGVYIEGNIDKFNKNSSKYLERTELINQPLNLYTRTKGKINNEEKIKRPFGFGVELNWYSKNRLLGLELSGGAKYQNKKSFLTSEGFDEILEGKVVKDSKPYCFTKSFEEKRFVPSIGVEAYLSPFKNILGIGFGIEKVFGKVQNEKIKYKGSIKIKF